MTIYRFGRFAFDTVDRTLRTSNGKVIALPPTATALLGALIGQPGRVIEKDALLTAVWPGVNIESATLARQVSRLREHLGDVGRKPKVIATVARRGYRFAALVTRVEARRRDRSDTRISLKGPIAVLPFRALSADVLDLAHGLTESLAMRLTQLPGLRVIGLASVLQFGGPDLSPIAAMEALGAETALCGTVRRQGNGLSASVEVLTKDKGTRILACRARVDRKRAPWLEPMLVRKLVAALDLLPADSEHSREPGPATRSLAAYSNLIAGLRLTKDFTQAAGLESAIPRLEEAIRLDPALISAQLALADLWLKLRLFGGPIEPPGVKARVALDAVLSRDPSHPFALAMSGSLREEMEWERIETLATIRLAAKLGPDDPAVLFWCSMFLARRGLYEEAEKHVIAGLTLDPLSLELMVSQLYIRYLTGQHQAFRKQLRNMERFAPPSGFLKALAALCYADAGDRRRAVDAAREVVGLYPFDVPGCAWSVLALSRLKAFDEAQAIIDHVDSLRERGYVSPYVLAAIRAAVGQNAAAFQWLDVAADVHAPHLLYAPHEPWFDSIRQTRRFRALMMRIHA